MEPSGVSIEPFAIAVPQDALDDLRERLVRTRWPRLPATGWRDGVDTEWLRGLISYWLDGFDWRAIERRLNAYDHRRVEVDGQRVHVVVADAAVERPPVLLLHGWPGGFIQMLDLADRLNRPADFGEPSGAAIPVVIASLPGFAFSDPSPLGREDLASTADLLDRVMREGLGRERYAVHGSDFGAGVAAQLAARHPASLVAVHLQGNTPRADGVTADDSPALQRMPPTSSGGAPKRWDTPSCRRPVRTPRRWH